MRYTTILFALVLFISCKQKNETTTTREQPTDSIVNHLIHPEEKHFKSLRQVTFGGDNAEAYWSFDDKQLVFQSNYENWGVKCDQMFVMNVDDTFEDKQTKMVSTGVGRTTCAYFLPDNTIIYA